jgi:hypothetical protein|eukprot:7391370-Prymnesium_polylepis.3
MAELSGVAAPPNDGDPSSPTIAVALYPMGGFCAVSMNWNRFPQNVEVEGSTKAIQSNGMNAKFGEKVYCAAALPHTTFLRLSVSDAGQEVAYNVMVLGRLRRGYHVFQVPALETQSLGFCACPPIGTAFIWWQMRNLRGTRIELAYIFVKISFSTMPNLWQTPREVRPCVAEAGGVLCFAHLDSLPHDCPRTGACTFEPRTRQGGGNET